jgi:hypothetical protein
LSQLLTTRRLAVFGTIGPILFVGIVILVTALEWDFLHGLGWHLVEDSPVVYPSATAMGPYGWLQTLNFAQMGLAVIGTAIGIWRTVKPRPRVGAGFVWLAGLAFLLSTFTTDGTSGTPTTWHGNIHGLAFLLLAFSTLFGAIALAVQLRKDPAWRPLAAVAPAAPIVLVASIVLTGALRQAGGLLSVIGILAIVAWYWLLGWRLLTLTPK